MNCVIESNSLILPIGTKFSIKQQNSSNKLKLLNARERNEFVAIFDENDVDFEIWCDNRECDRGIGLDLIINGCEHLLYIWPQKLCALKALETNGRKLHFVSENTDSVGVMVANTANKYGIRNEMDSINCSKIEFRVEVELCLNEKIEPTLGLLGGTKIFVHTVNGKKIRIDICLSNTIRDLKMIIADKEGSSPDKQRLMFAGKHLEDGKKLADYNIQRENTIYMVIGLRGGGCAPPVTQVNDGSAMQSLTVKTDTNTTDEPMFTDKNSNTTYNSGASQLFNGERGVICFGEPSNQTFTDYVGFEKDWNISVKSFVIEMRMDSRFEAI